MERVARTAGFGVGERHGSGAKAAPREMVRAAVRQRNRCAQRGAGTQYARAQRG